PTASEANVRVSAVRAPRAHAPAGAARTHADADGPSARSLRGPVHSVDAQAAARKERRALAPPVSAHRARVANPGRGATQDYDHGRPAARSTPRSHGHARPAG